MSRVKDKFGTNYINQSTIVFVGALSVAVQGPYCGFMFDVRTRNNNQIWFEYDEDQKELGEVEHKRLIEEVELAVPEVNIRAKRND